MLQNKVNGWSARWLSKGGKKVLIKSIALALPTYDISNFLLSLDICEKFERANAHFWWSSNPLKKSSFEKKKEETLLPREEGNISFHMIHEFNLALLATQSWKLV